ncbi:MAG: hypothetical protein J6X39_03410 [Bacteroidales bacterium]|nr:hypothetical protein [Bacteroidales bacterium]
MKSFRPIVSVFIFLLIGCFCASAGQQKRVLFLRAELNGTPFTASEEYLDSILNASAEYFNGQLDSAITVSFDLGPVVSLTGAYTNETAHLAVEEACRLANPGINFRAYDSDSDGAVDCIGVIFSGSEIWPQHHRLQGKNISLHLDHVLIDEYAALAEILYEKPLQIGPVCHEFGHALGLQDLYDTDELGSGGLAEGLWGSLALMDRGDHNDSTRTPAGLSAIDFDILQLGQRDTLLPGEYVLSPFSRSHEYLYYQTETPGEYFLFECRAPEGWDSYIGGSGLLIYHVDKSSNRAGFSSYYNITLRAYDRWLKNEVNARPDHQCADLVEAMPGADTVTAVFFPQGERQTFCSDGEPAFRAWDGTQARYALKDIRIMPDSSVTFTVIEPIANVRQTAFQGSAILVWQIDRSLLGEIDSCTVALSPARGEAMLEKVMPASDGRLTFMPDSLKGGTSYNTLLTVYTPDAVFSKSGSFKTMVIDNRNTIPFIYFTGGVRNKDGTFEKGARFPLYVHNAVGAEEINWYFGDRPAVTDSEGMFTVSANGTLRAEVRWADGTTDVIVKEIQVKQ